MERNRDIKFMICVPVACLNKQTMSSFPLLPFLACALITLSRPIKVQRQQMRAHSLAQKGRLPASPPAPLLRRSSSKFLPIGPLRPRMIARNLAVITQPRDFCQNLTTCCRQGMFGRMPCNLDIFISTCPTPGSTSYC